MVEMGPQNNRQSYTCAEALERGRTCDQQPIRDACPVTCEVEGCDTVSTCEDGRADTSWNNIGCSIVGATSCRIPGFSDVCPVTCGCPTDDVDPTDGRPHPDNDDCVD